jgi:adenylate kinase
MVRRSDDTEAVVRNRLGVYDQRTRPLLDFYRLRPTYSQVNGADETAQVTEALNAVLDAVNGRLVGTGQPA